MPYTREDWKKAQAAVAEIEAERKALLAPTDARYDAACEALEEIEEDLPDMIARCEGCSDPIFEGDPYLGDSEHGIYTCPNCSPTWQDMLDDFASWEDTETGEAMTEARAHEWADKHLANGGKLTDSMAT